MKGIVCMFAGGSAPAIFALACVLALASCGRDAPEATLDSVKGFLAKRDFKSATIQLKNVLQKNPENPEARFLLGKLLFESGQLPVAMVELQRARDLKYASDEVVPILCYRGRVAPYCQHRAVPAHAGTLPERNGLHVRG